MDTHDVLAKGGNVSVEAVPGAGKTRLLLEACVPGTLVLAYNAQLAEAMEPPEGSWCWTFHAFCSKCLAPARDDAQLEDAVTRAERGELVPHDVPTPLTRLLVDEAQDVRALYVRLIRVLVPDHVPILVAGDRNQLVYDFSAEYPATLDTLLSPERAFGGGEWHKVTLPHSYRLTKPMAHLVNTVFGTSIVGVRDGPEVEVRSPRSAFSMYATLKDVLGTSSSDTLLLVDRKRGNRPLRSLLNALSRDGVRVFVHGVDGDTADEDFHVKCLTYWAAKGLECDTAVVLLPASAPRNPLYVGLTRARRRLIVVLDPREPNAVVSRAIVAEPHVYDVQNVTAMRAAEAGVASDAADFATREPSVSRPASSCDVIVPGGDDPSSPLTTALLDAAVRVFLVLAEWRATGAVRAMEDVLHPTRLDYEARDAAVRAGFVGRAVPRFVSDDDLLAPDLRRVATAAYARLKRSRDGGDPSLYDVAEVALATLAWDGYDHRMRRALPVAPWIHRLPPHVVASSSFLPPDAVYDVPLPGTGRRVHATSAEAHYLVTWDGGDEDAAFAAQHHPARTCMVLDLSNGEVRRVNVPD